MTGKRRVLAIIPARSGSKGLPDKNIRMLHGKHLLGWPVAAALGCPLIDRTVVSTDSARYAEIARGYGAEVPFLRPPELARDTSPSMDFIMHMIGALEGQGDRFDDLVLLEPTSPLTDSADVESALKRLWRARGHADSIVGVSRMETTHPDFAVRMEADDVIHPLLAPDFGALQRRQDLKPVFCLDGSLYISKIEALRREGSFCHRRTLGFETARHKVFEVDDLVDFLCIEAVMKNLPLVTRGSANQQEH